MDLQKKADVRKKSNRCVMSSGLEYQKHPRKGIVDDQLIPIKSIPT